MPSSIEFEARSVTATFLDPRLGFAPRERTIDLRRDPLTDRTVRILPPRRLPHPPPAGVPAPAAADAERCPFCAPRVFEVTPRSHLLEPSGRLAVGEAFLFPNLHPYGLESAVCLFSTSHDLRLFDFDERRIADALRACRDYAHQAVRRHGAGAHAAVAGNYLPAIGSSSIPHPHLQVVVDPTPVTLSRHVADGVERYRVRTGRPFHPDLVEAESAAGRHVARTRRFDWIAPFAPLGTLHLQAVGRTPAALEELTDDTLEDLADGVVRAFRYYAGRRAEGLHLALVTPPAGAAEARSFPPLLNLVGRSGAEAHDRNDATALARLFGETAVDVPPELVAREAKTCFRDI